MEDTSQEGQEKEEQQDKGNIKSEDNAIEMSEDFDGQMHDGDENEPGLLHIWFCLLSEMKLTLIRNNRVSKNIQVEEKLLPRSPLRFFFIICR